MGLPINVLIRTQQKKRNMHTILGANGIIGEELARELKSNYSSEIKLVGRNPQKVNDSDLLQKGDLLVLEDVKNALRNTEIAYLTVGLPYDSNIWLRDWKLIMQNVIEGCVHNNCKLAYFDNTYAYPQDSITQTEDTIFGPSGKKGLAKKQAAELLLKAVKEKKLDAVICRAPEFYGPGKTKGVTNAMIFDNLRAGKKPRVVLNDKVLRTLIYTPDASKAMALIANTPDTYGQTWHLPCDDNRLTYAQFIDEIGKQLSRKINYQILSRFIINLVGLFNSNVREIKELLPRYEIDNIFESKKFKNRFPEFKVTSYVNGIKEIIEDYQIK